MKATFYMHSSGSIKVLMHGTGNIYKWSRIFKGVEEEQLHPARPYIHTRTGYGKQL